jgi:phosphinothricin acetyltransferase
MNDLILRSADERDLPAITAIYNQAVLTTTATFDTDPVSLDSRLAWFNNRNTDFPVIVAVVSGNVVGYAALSRWSDRRAFDISAELSLYVDAAHHGQGVGKALLKRILEMADTTQLYTVMVRITAENEISLKMHAQVGFLEVGVLRHCGIKFGRVLDVVFMQKLLR